MLTQTPSTIGNGRLLLPKLFVYDETFHSRIFKQRSEQIHFL